MAISSIRGMDGADAVVNAPGAPAVPGTGANREAVNVSGTVAAAPITPDGAGTDKTKSPEKELEKYRLSQDTLTRLMQESNQFLSAINTDIRFAWHQKAERLMVQVYDQRDNRVLKEFPPHEFLDTIAKIREYVGSLVDTKV
ncbi:flagellar protein FlaG [Heliophilum fasciatum]|uniref:Putative FlaG/YvyC family protein n=1 Tax=Heliophilum fasciatum TaxID=35700 RepID=A0A4R2RVY0_9FIRM|nr:flagellar protein FlaG [Heliophilum fasciatum]MCW2278803.1 flagellar protein FlaG [Heliophilum fasciatum]TCP64111.1 putative FlaG/YvyC family protein [Heliophilum fasciatum]